MVLFDVLDKEGDVLPLEVDVTDWTNATFTSLVSFSMIICMFTGFKHLTITGVALPALSCAPDVPFCPDTDLSYHMSELITWVGELAIASRTRI